MLCESNTGYLSKFIIYTGATTDYGNCSDINLPVGNDDLNLPDAFDDYKSPSRVVLSLMRPFLDKGYVLTLDNYYTSPELAIALLNAQTVITGHFARKRPFGFQDFWSWKPNKGPAQNEPL